jgi:hypothetical protein
MKKTLIVLLTFAMLLSTVSVAMGGFEDAPKASHWAYDNFTLLYNVGLLKGYPDGTFKGERYATRYEMVELTARVLQYLEGRLLESGTVLPSDGKAALNEAKVKELVRQSLSEETVSQAELDDVYTAIQELENEFKDELAKRSDVNITTLENRVASLETRMDEQDAQVEALNQNVKKGKTLSIVGIILGVAGIVFGFVP